MIDIDFEKNCELRYGNWLKQIKGFSDINIENIVKRLSVISRKFTPLMCGYQSFYPATTEREIYMIFQKLSSDEDFFKANIEANYQYLDAVQLYYEFVISEQNTRNEMKDTLHFQHEKIVENVTSLIITNTHDSDALQRVVRSAIQKLNEFADCCLEISKQITNIPFPDVSQKFLFEVSDFVNISQEMENSINKLMDIYNKATSKDKYEESYKEIVLRGKDDKSNEKDDGLSKKKNIVLELPLKTISDIEIIRIEQEKGNVIKIEQYVQFSLKYLLDRELLLDHDIDSLQDEDWCRKTFHIAYAMFREYDFAQELSNLTIVNKCKCYWDIIFQYKGKNYLVYSLWYESNRKHFDKWLNFFADSVDVISEWTHINEQQRLQEQSAFLNNESELITFAIEYNSIALPKDLLGYIFKTISELDEREIFINRDHLDELVSKRIRTETIYDDSYLPLNNILVFLQDIKAIVPYKNGKRGNFKIVNEEAMKYLILNPSLVYTYANEDDF